MSDYKVQLKRVYESAGRSDGARVLVDRLWPRGKRKADLQLTEWYRDAAPSTNLRRAWHAREIDAEQFASYYRGELQDAPDSLTPLMRYARQGRLTLLTAAKEIEQSHLPILRSAIMDALWQEDEEADGREPSSPVCYEDSRKKHEGSRKRHHP